MPRKRWAGKENGGDIGGGDVDGVKGESGGIGVGGCGAGAGAVLKLNDKTTKATTKAKHTEMKIQKNGKEKKNIKEKEIEANMRKKERKEERRKGGKKEGAIRVPAVLFLSTTL
ncbi:Hypothetical predicted protein [Octopus vulgaris]|uniref:Uncharacterized protein n=1 Tax=Octopus vulgaris TaxID=6645 RepID=A0AA36BMU1_OCTVU|nr:Hypothetical predicted protein [Octopus vulgaris]